MAVKLNSASIEPEIKVLAKVSRAVQQSVWSPDGTQVAFIEAENEEKAGTLWIINAEGSGLRILAEHVRIGRFYW
jgi:Tol biopolymer transport system component